jgi:hypothetical protein
MDTRYARRRMANEPLTEMMQTKGGSETHPLMSPNDEFADFEPFPNLINVGKPSQVKYGYARQALTDGLMLERTLGINPFKYGIVAGAAHPERFVRGAPKIRPLPEAVWINPPENSTTGAIAH